MNEQATAASTQTASTPCVSPIPGPKVMLLGEPGSGKTFSCRTYLEAGITPFFLFTDPGMEVVSDCDEIHWKYIAPTSPSWATFIDSARKINTLSHDALSKLPDINKQQYNQFVVMLETLANFTCDHCGEAFGAVDHWNTDRALVMDGMSGMSQVAMDLVAGSKPVKSQANWGVAMDNLNRLIIKLATGLKCHMTLIGHLEREHNEVTGAVELMVSTLGRKLAPTLGRHFSDIIHCRRAGDKWVWSTDTVNVATKTRNIALGGDLPPSFTSLITKWQNAGGKICPTTV